MINRRTMLKILGLAPVAAPIAVAAAAPISAPTRYALVGGDYFPLSDGQNPVVIMGRVSGSPIYDPRIALNCEVGPELTWTRSRLSSTAAPTKQAHSPYHPELTVHA